MCEPRFDNKIVLITGASQGLGEQLTKDIAKRGASKIIIAARREDQLERVRQETGFPDKIQILKLDLADPDKVLEQMTEFFDKQQVDIVINNGGVS